MAEAVAVVLIFIFVILMPVPVEALSLDIVFSPKRELAMDVAARSICAPKYDGETSDKDWSKSVNNCGIVVKKFSEMPDDDRVISDAIVGTMFLVGVVIAIVFFAVQLTKP